MGNYKWMDNDSDREKDYKVIFFVSRNKDNGDILGFKERRESYFRHYNEDKMRAKFKDFINRGLPGEFCRMYVSNNARNPNKVHKELLKLLIDKDELNFDYIEPTIAGLAAKKECAAESKWFFDFDDNNIYYLHEFIHDINKCAPDVKVSYNQTPHGYAVIVDRGFDTRGLLKTWGDKVTLKRDDLICVDWEFKPYENN